MQFESKVSLVHKCRATHSVAAGPD